MAIVATLVTNRATYKKWDVTALDADTTVNVPHGFGVAPDDVTFTMRGAAIALAAGGNWSIGTIDATNIQINKLNTAGSGGAVPGTTVVITLLAKLPHSIIG